eukprot:scaffold194813_cov13-Tisochrysis_lutea.AAC.1
MAVQTADTPILCPGAGWFLLEMGDDSGQCVKLVRMFALTANKGGQRTGQKAGFLHLPYRHVITPDP